jgi:hypothetical protein
MDFGGLAEEQQCGGVEQGGNGRAVDLGVNDALKQASNTGDDLLCWPSSTGGRIVAQARP